MLLHHPLNTLHSVTPDTKYFKEIWDLTTVMALIIGAVGKKKSIIEVSPIEIPVPSVY